VSEFASWMVGAVLVAISAVSGGYGAGMMWRAWQTITVNTEAARIERDHNLSVIDAVERRLNSNGGRGDG
jgi:hypothetical protein